MQIKPAHPDDAARLAEMWYQGWHQAHASVVPTALTTLRTPEEFTMRMRVHLKHTKVAWVDGQIAGFFMVDHDEIYQFYINAAFQGSGLAQQMMAATEAELGHGLKWLACTVGNTRAARFYEACGWVQAGAIPYEVETGEGPLQIDVWRYEKRLGPVNQAETMIVADPIISQNVM
ncbi:MAG: GNAT family N-acetyltransferase [Sulfitobacter sp.]|jgi:GNAT superfamily N-acetyltransferase|uniref:GNAT family N-acetyltransferase n=1 Tax=unclassified Sulfitobacter TaxID=196795 RepID=UPI0011109182|nr:GNAT family N-acetyltransferase [Sulfitobacter sp. BSw21498]